MTTFNELEREAQAVIDDLIALTLELSDAYRIASKRLNSFSLRLGIQPFVNDYERQANDLTPALRAMGGHPTRRSRLRTEIEKVRIALAALFGDRALLAAAKAQEERAAKEYERARERFARRP